MNRTRQVLSNINVINILLLLLLAFFVRYVLTPVQSRKVQYIPAGVKTQAATAPDKAKTDEGKSPSPSDYTLIADNNLFHPERIIPVPKVEGPPLPVPEFVLYGTLITDKVKVAYMEDKKSPQNSPGRGKRQSAVSEGQSLSGFTVKEIVKDQVTMLRGQEKVVVALNDPQKPKVREIVQTAPAGAVPGQPEAQQPQSKKPAAKSSTAASAAPPVQTPKAQPKPTKAVSSAQQSGLDTNTSSPSSSFSRSSSQSTGTRKPRWSLTR